MYVCICVSQAYLKQLCVVGDLKCRYLGQPHPTDAEAYEIEPEKWTRVAGRFQKSHYDVSFEWQLPWGARAVQSVRAENAILRGVPQTQLSATFLLYSLRKAAVTAAVDLNKELVEQCGIRVRCEYSIMSGV